MLLLLLLSVQQRCTLVLSCLQLLFLILSASFYVCVFLNLRPASPTRIAAACITVTQPTRECTLSRFLYTHYVDCATDQHRGWVAPIQLRLTPKTNQTGLQVPSPLFALNVRQKSSHCGRLIARWKHDIELCSVQPTVAPLRYTANK